jgi:hypothetical protein
MFETQRFKEQLAEAVSMEVANNNLERYENAIIDYLQRLASGNESDLMERELRKAPGTQRGVRDAVNSARELTKDASRYALADKRTTLRVVDIDAAYKARFCQFWPFCKQ